MKYLCIILRKCRQHSVSKAPVFDRGPGLCWENSVLQTPSLDKIMRAPIGLGAYRSSSALHDNESKAKSLKWAILWVTISLCSRLAVKSFDEPLSPRPTQWVWRAQSGVSAALLRHKLYELYKNSQNPTKSYKITPLLATNPIDATASSCSWQNISFTTTSAGRLSATGCGNWMQSLSGILVLVRCGCDAQ